MASSAAGNPAFLVEDPGLRSTLLDAFELSLAGIRDDNDLSNIFVVGPRDTTWIDLSGVVARHELNPFLDLDFSAVALARSGLASYSKLYDVGGWYMKSGYAPILDRDGSVVAIVGVEAGAGCFSTLGSLRGILLGVNLGSGAGIFALGFLFFAINRKLTRAQQALEGRAPPLSRPESS